MNDRIKETFDKIYVEAELKERTKEFIAYKTNNYKSGRINLYRKMAPVMACLLFILLGFGGTPDIFYKHCNDQYRYQSVN